MCGNFPVKEQFYTRRNDRAFYKPTPGSVAPNKRPAMRRPSASSNGSSRGRVSVRQLLNMLIYQGQALFYGKDVIPSTGRLTFAPYRVSEWQISI